MIERFQIYQLTVPSVPVGGIKDYPLQLNTDAPFALRMVKSRNIFLNGWRFQTPRKSWQSNQLRTEWYGAESLGTQSPGRGAPIYPELIYPIGGNIVCDIGNATNAPLVNARLLFYGSKLFANGSINAPTYPARISPLPTIYQVDLNSVGLAQSPTIPWVQRDVQLKIRHDADVAIRHVVCDPFTLGVEGGPVVLSGSGTPGEQPNFQEVYVSLMDESKKAYSNEPIHVNDIFGQGLPSPDPVSAGANSSLGVGPYFPGLMTPEIYVERDHSLYMDVYRFDQAGFPVDLHFRFQGPKVFKQ